MSVIFTKDALRASVEAASGGRVTVLYNDKGHPSYMAVIPKFNLQDLDSDLPSGVHPAFLVNGTEKDELLYGLHLASLHDGRAVSLPGVDPANNINYDDAKDACFANGPGWHLSTIFEWSAFKMWCMANDHQPRGNTDWGRHHDTKHETAVRADGYPIGDSDGNGRTLTGSGPMSWRHDNSPFGVADLVGNIREWQHLMKIDNGRIYLPNDNHYDLDEGDWTARDSYFDMDGGSPKLSDEVTTTGSESVTWVDMAVKTGFAPHDAIIKAGLSPKIDGDSNIMSLFDGILGRLHANNEGERFPNCGGHRSNGSDAGLAYLHLHHGRSYTHSTIGFRPAYLG